MNATADVLAMDERTYRLWSEQTKGAIFTWTSEAAARLIPARKSVGSVAVIPLSGFLSQKPSLFSMLFGGTSVEAFAREVVAALGDQSIGAVVLDVDSPGGEVFGVTEAATAIRAARGTKPLVAVANPIAASAAYWLASQADEVVVTPSGLAGSVGVFTVHQDVSKALEQQGVGVRFISYGRRKTEGNPVEPLSEDALASIQVRVDEAGRTFEADVAKGRGVSVAKVHSDFGEGGILTASQAVAAGAADRVATLEEVVGRLVDGRRPKGSARAYDAKLAEYLAFEAGVKIDS
jgi:signal peptide peptidase SppA